MYRLNPNRINVNNITPKPIVNANQSNQQTSVENKESAIDIKKMKEDFENVLKEKLVKVDEFMNEIKERQDKLEKNTSEKLSQKVENVPVIKQNATEKQRTKKTYYSISESMWNEVKSRMPELPDNYKNQLYSDGVDVYVNEKNKKSLLDTKMLLKLINKK
jgi:ElaB/YqjD/DUF883 family membrane-anchored ribosome-binding protein